MSQILNTYSQKPPILHDSGWRMTRTERTHGTRSQEMCGSSPEVSLMATVTARPEGLSSGSPGHSFLLFGNRLFYWCWLDFSKSICHWSNAAKWYSDILHCCDEKNPNSVSCCLPFWCETLSCLQVNPGALTTALSFISSWVMTNYSVFLCLYSFCWE